MLVCTPIDSGDPDAEPARRFAGGEPAFDRLHNPQPEINPESKRHTHTHESQNRGTKESAPS